jgi:hypothetical protein
MVECLLVFLIYNAGPPVKLTWSFFHHVANQAIWIDPFCRHSTIVLGDLQKYQQKQKRTGTQQSKGSTSFFNQQP